MDRNSVRGVTLRDILEYVQPSKALDQLFILQRSVPGPDGRSYDSCLCAVDTVRDDTIICYEMDGKPLSLELGWLARLIDLQLLGYKQVKCLAELKLTTVFQLEGWEKEAGYDPKG
jgi:DMSO/TMAO reductase YedYZ molybdopterin-dependent catalytic subunit